MVCVLCALSVGVFPHETSRTTVAENKSHRELDIGPTNCSSGHGLASGLDLYRASNYEAFRQAYNCQDEICFRIVRNKKSISNSNSCAVKGGHGAYVA